MDTNQILKTESSTINSSQNQLNLCRRKKKRKTGW